MDPDFELHRAIAQVMAFSVLALADGELLPMNVTRYAEKLSLGVKTLVENHGEALRKDNITTGKCEDVELSMSCGENVTQSR
jgi:hypothetical protein